MKRPAPKPACIDGQQIRNSIEHLPRGFIREREQQDISRIDPVLEQVRNPVGECARFATACACDHEQRTGRSRYSRKLLFIQLCRVIDVDRCRCWRALERVLTGHEMIADCGSQIAERTAASPSVQTDMDSPGIARRGTRS